MDLCATQVELGAGELVMPDSTERVFTFYTAKMRAQASYYHGLLNSILGDGLSFGEYLGRYLFHVREEGYYVHTYEPKVIRKTKAPPRTQKVMLASLKLLHRSEFVRPIVKGIYFRKLSVLICRVKFAS